MVNPIKRYIKKQKFKKTWIKENFEAMVMENEEDFKNHAFSIHFERKLLERIKKKERRIKFILETMNLIIAGLIIALMLYLFFKINNGYYF